MTAEQTFGLWMIRLSVAAALLGVIATAVCAQAAKPSVCGPTSIGGTATALTFPASGGGPTTPYTYLTIANPNASGFFCVSTGATTAAVSGSGCAAGSFYVGALSSPFSWARPSYPPPSVVNIVGSTAGLAVTCNYQ